MKQPNLFISGQAFNVRPISFRISKDEYSVFAFDFKEKDKRVVTVYVTSELRERLIKELKERDFVGIKIDKLETKYAKYSFKLKDFKIYRSVSN